MAGGDGGDAIAGHSRRRRSCHQRSHRMSDEAIETVGWWQQLWRYLAYTPLKDWSRGRMTAVLDLKALVARSELPEELRAIVYKTSRHTRLWRGERIDAALELIS